MLHVIGDVVGRRLRELLAFLVAAAAGLRVVDRLPLLEHLDRAIDPRQLRRSTALRINEGHRSDDQQRNEHSVSHAFLQITADAVLITRDRRT